jgi:hypothetical protein
MYNQNEEKNLNWITALDFITLLDNNPDKSYCRYANVEGRVCAKRIPVTREKSLYRCVRCRDKAVEVLPVYDAPPAYDLAVANEVILPPANKIISQSKGKLLTVALPPGAAPEKVLSKQDIDDLCNTEEVAKYVDMPEKISFSNTKEVGITEKKIVVTSEKKEVEKVDVEVKLTANQKKRLRQKAKKKEQQEIDSDLNLMQNCCVTRLLGDDFFVYNTKGYNSILVMVDDEECICIAVGLFDVVLESCTPINIRMLRKLKDVPKTFFKGRIHFDDAEDYGGKTEIINSNVNVNAKKC